MSEQSSKPRFLLFVGILNNTLMRGADCYIQSFTTLRDAIRAGERFAEHAFGEEWKKTHGWKREDAWWNVLEISDLKTPAIVHFGHRVARRRN